MRRILFVLAFLSLGGLSLYAAQEEVPFKQYNPDIGKYDFAKSYITSLAYFSRIADRLAQEDKAALQSKTDARAIRELIDHRTMDNTELRIAKNYLTKYLKSPNGLMRKVAVDTTAIYETMITLSIHERDLWQTLEDFKSHNGSEVNFRDEEFAGQQVALAREKKELGKSLIQQSLKAAKVLLSAERCSSENCTELAINDKERDKLSKRLDEFAQGQMDWGMKPGQSTIQACVATLREVLEDPLYHSRP